VNSITCVQFENCDLVLGFTLNFIIVYLYVVYQLGRIIIFYHLFRILFCIGCYPCGVYFVLAKARNLKGSRKLV